MKYLYDYLLTRILEKECPNIISRSGEEGKLVNCFSVRVDKNNEPFLLVNAYRDEKIIGKKWNGNQFEGEFEISIEEIEDYDLFIIHYYGFETITFKGIYDYAKHYFSKYIYLKVFLRNSIQNIDQYFFNKKKIITKDRLNLLKFMLNMQLDRNNNGIGLIDLMTELYSIKWVYHPNKEDEKNRLKLYLESLLNSGDLKNSNNKYIVNGKAISTLERYERDDEKHIISVKLQRKMLLLTFVILLVAVIQADIVKVPIIWDFTENSQTIKSDQ